MAQDVTREAKSHRDRKTARIRKKFGLGRVAFGAHRTVTILLGKVSQYVE